MKVSKKYEIIRASKKISILSFNLSLILIHPGSWTNFFIAFSLQKNTKKLLDSAKKPFSSPLRHLDGIRFISVCWIICGHTYFYTDFVHYHHYRESGPTLQRMLELWSTIFPKQGA